MNVTRRPTPPELADTRPGYRRWRWKAEEPPEVEAILDPEGHWDWVCSRCGPGRCEHVASILASEPVDFPDREDREE